MSGEDLSSVALFVIIFPVFASDMGCFHLIHEEVLKSAELTGIWEKHLRDIEKGSYEPHQFLYELKQMLCGIVSQVLNDATNRRIN